MFEAEQIHIDTYLDILNKKTACAIALLWLQPYEKITKSQREDLERQKESSLWKDCTRSFMRSICAVEYYLSAPDEENLSFFKIIAMINP